MMEPHGLHTLLSFLGFLALLAFFGLSIAKIWLVPAHAFGAQDLFLRWQQMLEECLGLLTIAAIMLLLVRTAEMDSGSLEEVLSDVPVVLTRTHFGSIWSVHLATLLGLWICCSVCSSRSASRLWSAVVVAGMLVLAFTHSASSHASDAGDFTLSELNDWMHVVSTSVWGGAILASALLIFPMLKTQDALISEVAIRLSSLAGVALAVVLITGIYNALLRLPDWQALTGTNYGRVLSTKLVIVSLLILVGAFNRFAVIPRIKRHVADPTCPVQAPVRLIFRALIVDAALVVLVVIAAAVLVQMEPDKASNAGGPSAVYGGGDQ